MKTIFFLLFLFSHTIGLEIYSQALFERSGRTILSYGDTSYVEETKRVATTGNVTTCRIIDMAGMRINFTLTTMNMANKFIRVVYKTNYSLRAGSQHEQVILSCLVMKMMLSQSWVINMWSDHFPFGNAFLSTSGPGFELQKPAFSEINVGILLISEGLKIMTFSYAELSAMKTKFYAKSSAINQTPLFAALDVFSFFQNSSVAGFLHNTNTFPIIRGFPYHYINKMFIHSFTLQDCERTIQDWAQAPLEILIIDNTNQSNENIIDIVLPIWTKQLPRTDYKTNGSVSGFISLGEEIIIPCQSGFSGEVCLLLMINLGPLSDKSIIAADLVISQFRTYANLDRGWSSYAGFFLVTAWAPCSGCAVVSLLFIYNKNSTDKYTQIGLLRKAIHDFRSNFTLQLISNHLFSGWAGSLGQNQQNRNIWNWPPVNLGELASFSNWLLETFGNESSFEDLKILASNPASSTYEGIYEILQNAFLPRSKRFNIWVFEKS